MDNAPKTEAFPRYEKIAENAASWNLEPSAWRKLSKVRWAVTEKVHGANFCLWTNGREVATANRREWLHTGDVFWNWQNVLEQNRVALQTLWGGIQTMTPDCSGMYVYGELFGGTYTHPEVPPVAGARPAQTGIWYAPDVRFMAFDIRVETKQGAAYLDFEETINRCRTASLFCAEPLLVGTYNQAIAYPIRFDSTLPRRLGLPTLPPGTNFAEGIVLKPWCEAVVQTPAGPIRPILKRKIAEFAEDKRFQEAEKSEPPKYNGALDLAKWEAYNRITVNRWHGTVSKVGGGKEAEQTALTLFCAEVETEARVAAPDAFAALTPREQAEFEKYVKHEAIQLIGKESKR